DRFIGAELSDLISPTGAQPSVPREPRLEGRKAVGPAEEVLHQIRRVPASARHQNALAVPPRGLVERSNVGSCSLCVTSEAFSSDAGRGRAASRALLDRTSDASGTSIG